MQQITEHIGSGPFIFNENETKPGSRYVYDRNPNYVPRSEPAIGLAGGKVAKLDRVIWDNMADDADRARRAAGRRDRLLRAAADRPHRSARGGQEYQGRGAEQDRQCRLMRLNCLHPPFNNVEGAPGDALPRQPGRHHEGDLRQSRNITAPAAPSSPAARRWRTTRIPSGSRRRRTSPRPQQLFKEAGYDGRPVVAAAGDQHRLHEQRAASSWRNGCAQAGRQRRSLRPPTGAAWSPAAPSRSRRTRAAGTSSSPGSGAGMVGNPITFVGACGEWREGLVRLAEGRR